MGWASAQGSGWDGDGDGVGDWVRKVGGLRIEYDDDDDDEDGSDDASLRMGCKQCSTPHKAATTPPVHHHTTAPHPSHPLTYPISISHHSNSNAQDHLFFPISICPFVSRNLPNHRLY